MNVAAALESIVAFIVRSLNPQSVILFGSVTQGRAGPNSDIDLLVIGGFREARALRGRELGALFEQYAMPIDVQCYTTEEFNREAADASSFAAMVARHGDCLYGKPVLYENVGPKKELPESSPRKNFQ